MALSLPIGGGGGVGGGGWLAGWGSVIVPKARFTICLFDARLVDGGTVGGRVDPFTKPSVG